MSSESKQQWGSRLGVILAVAGSAVGLGNFLRFPGTAASNGGGAFMIPYFVALLLLGIPIGWAEWAMGRYGGRKGFNSAPAIMGVIGRGRLPRYLGIIGVLIPIAVYFYYVLIEAWCLSYCIQFFSGGLGIDPQASSAAQSDVSKGFFTFVTGQDADGHFFTHPKILGIFLLTTVLNIWFVFRGLSKGIERFCKWAMPTMAVCAVIVLARVLTLDPNPDHPEQNVMSGLAFMWEPDWTKLKEAKTWIAAAGQIFFSLSVGFGVIINYASYMKKKDDVVLSGLTSASTNEVFEVVFGGLISLTAAFIFFGAAASTFSTFGLGFTTLPIVFAHMPYGNLFGGIWFFMLFLAAITSSLSMLQPTKAFVQEALGTNNFKATVITSIVALIGNTWIMYFSKDLVALTVVDDWVGTFLIVVLALVQVVCFGWIFGVDRGLKEAHEGSRMRIPGFFRIVIKFIAPAYLVVAISWFIVDVDSLPKWFKFLQDNPVAQWTMGLIITLIGFLVWLTYIGEKRWRAAGLDLDGNNPPDDERPVPPLSNRITRA